MSVTIRNAQQGDALRIAQIHVAAWQKGYSNLMNADFLKSLSIEDMLVSWTKALEGSVRSSVSILYYIQNRIDSCQRNSTLKRH